MKHWSDETRWQPLAEVVAGLKAKVEAAYATAQEADLDAAHDELVAVEHRLRMAKRRAGHA
jgi:hypothetical protein